MHETTRTKFIELFGENDIIRTFFSPGRVNLIGEHIDYNGGFVFPCALSIGNYGAISLRKDDKIRFFSENFLSTGIIETSLTDLDYRSKHGWANYAKGIIQSFLLLAYPITSGFDIYISGNLPYGAGLSSSASIEVLIATMLNDSFCCGISKKDIAILSKEVENDYMHVNCGIMDQFVIANGVKDHALMLDTNTLDYTLVPLVLEDYNIVICNSKVKRGLVDSQYNVRRLQCNNALALLQNQFDVQFLCEISMNDFNQYSYLIEDEILLKRARHVISENERTLKAHLQLINYDLIGFGKAINESHKSLKNDFEVSCDELDTLVSLALEFGSIGSRMTGGGFGGCTVNIVLKKDFEKFKDQVTSRYFEKYNLLPDILIANPSDGTKEI